MIKPKLVSILKSLTEAAAKVYKAAFDFSDVADNGLIKNKDVGTSMRLLLRNPSQNEVEEITKELDATAVGSLNFEQFVTALLRPQLVPLIAEEDVREAFRILDNTDDCLIPVELIKGYLTSLAERLDDEEMGEMLKIADPKQTGFFDYEQFVTAICKPPQVEKKKKRRKGRKK